ncbi:hypothetical protein D6817_04015 [Candidatus Pacearchaeota archaeon]|nr:MAG: hypothetical protein D6817_04015 [Candidatus Pacearchaeota archaeon]
MKKQIVAKKRASKITTLKLTKETKARLDKLKIYPKESYEIVLKRMLNILNICRVAPERAQKHLLKLERIKLAYRTEKNSSLRNKI